MRADGASYAWTGGVGPAQSVVSYSAICAHKLAYPTRDISFIRFQSERSPTSDGNVIHCCADHSVYDPAAGARVLSGPAPQPLAAILLDYDGATDSVAALGTVGAEQFDAFFRKYDFKLTMEYGHGKARMPVGRGAVVRELTPMAGPFSASRAVGGAAGAVLSLGAVWAGLTMSRRNQLGLKTHYDRARRNDILDGTNLTRFSRRRLHAVTDIPSAHFYHDCWRRIIMQGNPTGGDVESWWKNICAVSVRPTGRRRCSGDSRQRA